MKKKIVFVVAGILVLAAMVLNTIRNQAEQHDSVIRMLDTEDGGRIELITHYGHSSFPELIIRRNDEGNGSWELKWDNYFASNEDLSGNQYTLTKGLLIFPLTRVDEKGYIYRKITVVDYRTGSVAWSAPVPAGIDTDGFYSISDDSSLFAFNLDRMHGPLLTRLDLESGEEFWTVPAPERPGAPLMTKDYFILHYYSAEFSNAFIYNKETGQIRRIALDYAGFVRDEDFMYIVKDGQGYGVYRINMTTGEKEKLFSLQSPPPLESENSHPRPPCFALSGDLLLYQEPDDGAFKALSLKNGRIVWERRWSPDKTGRESYFSSYGQVDILNESPVNWGFYNIPSGYFPLVLQSRDGMKTYSRIVVLDTQSGMILREGVPLGDQRLSMERILYKEGEYFIIGENKVTIPSVSFPFTVPFAFVLDAKTGNFTRYYYPRVTTEEEQERLYKEEQAGYSLKERILAGWEIPWQTENINSAGWALFSLEV